MYNRTGQKAQAVKSYTEVCQVVEDLTPYQKHLLGYLFKTKTLFTFIFYLALQMAMLTGFTKEKEST
jgi:hypothetical protein